MTDAPRTPQAIRDELDRTTHWSDEHRAAFRRMLAEGAARLSPITNGDAAATYDATLWRPAHPAPGVRAIGVVLDRSVAPSMAVDAIARTPARWAMTPAQWAGAVLWYAMRHTYGADVFNAWVRSPAVGGSLVLGVLDCVPNAGEWRRSGGGCVARIEGDEYRDDRPAVDVVASMPPGARVFYWAADPSAPTARPTLACAIIADDDTVIVRGPAGTDHVARTAINAPAIHQAWLPTGIRRDILVDEQRRRAVAPKVDTVIARVRAVLADDPGALPMAHRCRLVSILGDVRALQRAGHGNVAGSDPMTPHRAYAAIMAAIEHHDERYPA